MEDYHQSSSLPATDWFVHCINEDSRINKRNANPTGNAHRVATVGPPAGKMACQDFSPHSTNHFPNSEILAEKSEEDEEGEEEETSPPVAKRSKRKQSEQSEESAALGAFNRLKSASKPHSTPLTLKWLEENYEIAPGVCIPRSTLYYHYLDFCEKHDTQPVNAASFGKIIRQQFQHITTRRLGTRGQSKYNYYGIGIRETSIYYDIMYSAKGVQNANGGKKDNVKQIIAYSPRSKLGTLLPDFPDLKDIKFPAEIGEDKAMTFMMMYRTHCQRILDTVIRANFDEVQSFLLHFWQGMPQHIVPILGHDVIVLLVGVCDSILYKAIASVLMPTVLQALPDSLTQVIRRFAKQLDDWLKQALESLPEGLQKLKFDLARRFSQVLRRQTSLNHLCQAARSVTQSPEMTSQMLDDWISVDTGCIVKQTLYTMDKYTEKEHGMIVKLCREFEKLLEEQAALECFIEWLDSMVERCVVQPSKRNPKCLRKSARQFLLMWSCFGTRIIRDMTLHSAPSFGSFHLLHLMFDEYVLYLVESLYSQERASDFLRVVKGEETESTEEDVLPDSSVIRNNLSLGTNISPLESHAREKEKNRCSVIQNQGLNDERFCNQSYFPSYSMVGFQSQTQKSPVQSMFSTIRQEGCSPQHFGQCVFPNFSQTCISSGNTCEDLSNYGMNTQLQISLPMSQGYISSSDSNRVNHLSDWTNQLSNISYVDSNRSCEMSSKNSNGSCTVIDGLGYNSVTTSDDLYRNSPIALKPVDGSKHHVNTDEVSNRVPQINNDIPLQQSSLNNNHI